MEKERDPVVDIESGGSESEEDSRNGLMTGKKRAKSLLRSLGGTLNFEGSDGEGSSNSTSSMKASEDEFDDIESVNDNKLGGDKVEHIPLIDKTPTKEKQRTSKLKKAPKPPRPRKGPSLDVADLQLVREISELAMKKRARMERLKALKKMQAAKSSSPSLSSIFALVVTILFFLAMIFQGQSTLSFQESPEPPTSAASGFVSVHYGNNFLDGDDLQRISAPPNVVEETSGSEPTTWVR